MIRIPAIDLRDGRVVRLRQGDFAAETRYEVNALALAQRYERDGATHLHVVDLDAARDGSATQRHLIAEICSGTGLVVQAGGGIRTRSHVEMMLTTGVERVVIGSVAVRAPEQVIAWAGEFGNDRILIALDTRLGADGVFRLPVSGWTESTEVTLTERIEQFLAAGISEFLCTDIARDGMLSGPNFELYAELAARYPGVRIQASGGLSTLADLKALSATGCAGVVMGRALLEGRFTLPEALAC
jgi:phosphoribosylformimino-5-aminoimidazole carboxamide ribotide isomerase